MACLTITPPFSSDDDHLGALKKRLNGLMVRVDERLRRRPIWAYAGVHPEDGDPSEDTYEIDSSGIEEAQPLSIEDIQYNNWLWDDRAYQDESRKWADGLS